MTDPERIKSELIHVQNQWKQLQSTAKEFREKKQQLLDELQAHMMATGQTQMELPDGTVLELRTKRNKAPLNEKELVRLLTLAFQGNIEQAQIGRAHV